MDFSWALVAVKKGAKIQRLGWNGKEMWLVHQAGYPDGISINKNTSKATGIPEGDTAYFLPYLMMKTADPGPTFVPWLASQTDILADDWQII